MKDIKSENNGSNTDSLPRSYEAWVIGKSAIVGGALGAVALGENTITSTEQNVPSDNQNELISTELSAEGALTGALVLGAVASVVVSRIKKNK